MSFATYDDTLKVSLVYPCILYFNMNRLKFLRYSRFIVAYWLNGLALECQCGIAESLKKEDLKVLGEPPGHCGDCGDCGDNRC